MRLEKIQPLDQIKERERDDAGDEDGITHWAVKIIASPSAKTHKNQKR